MLCIPKRGCLVINEGWFPIFIKKAVNDESAKEFASAIKNPAPAGD